MPEAGACGGKGANALRKRHTSSRCNAAALSAGSPLGARHSNARQTTPSSIRGTLHAACGAIAASACRALVFRASQDLAAQPGEADENRDDGGLASPSEHNPKPIAALLNTEVAAAAASCDDASGELAWAGVLPPSARAQPGGRAGTLVSGGAAHFCTMHSKVRSSSVCYIRSAWDQHADSWTTADRARVFLAMPGQCCKTACVPPALAQPVIDVTQWTIVSQIRLKGGAAERETRQPNSCI